VRKLKKFISTTATTLSLTLVSLAYGAPVLADLDISEPINLNIPGEWANRVPKPTSVSRLISSTIQVLLIVAAVFFFIYLLIGGIRWIMSGGDKGNIEKARGQITHALIGLLIVLGVWIINGILASLFGIDIISNIKLPNFTQ